MIYIRLCFLSFLQWTLPKIKSINRKQTTNAPEPSSIPELITQNPRPKLDPRLTQNNEQSFRYFLWICEKTSDISPKFFKLFESNLFSFTAISFWDYERTLITSSLNRRILIFIIGRTPPMKKAFNHILLCIPYEKNLCWQMRSKNVAYKYYILQQHCR